MSTENLIFYKPLGVMAKHEMLIHCYSLFSVSHSDHWTEFCGFFSIKEKPHLSAIIFEVGLGISFVMYYVSMYSKSLHDTGTGNSLTVPM